VFSTSHTAVALGISGVVMSQASKVFAPQSSARVRRRGARGKANRVVRMMFPI